MLCLNKINTLICSLVGSRVHRELAFSEKLIGLLAHLLRLLIH